MEPFLNQTPAYCKIFPSFDWCILDHMTWNILYISRLLTPNGLFTDNDVKNGDFRTIENDYLLVVTSLPWNIGRPFLDRSDHSPSVDVLTQYQISPRSFWKLQIDIIHQKYCWSPFYLKCIVIYIQTIDFAVLDFSSVYSQNIGRPLFDLWWPLPSDDL